MGFSNQLYLDTDIHNKIRGLKILKIKIIMKYSVLDVVIIIGTMTIKLLNRIKINLSIIRVP